MILSDIQKQFDTRGLVIQNVGIKEIKYPIRIIDQQGIEQSSIGLFDLSITLDATQKGAHLSRFIEVLESGPLYFSSSGEGLDNLLNYMKVRLQANRVFLAVSFPFFMEKLAPQTHLKSLMDYTITFRARKFDDAATQWETTIQVPVTSVCPCSKAISVYGAHNQRSILTLRIITACPVPIEYWIRLLEQQGSAEIFSLLKRPDEKWVTERAYENAKFVEDIVRDVSLLLNQDKNIFSYHIAANNIESIHNHSAYAEISSNGQNNLFD